MRAWNSLSVHLLNWLCLAGPLTTITGQALHYRIKLQRIMDYLYCTETVMATCASSQKILQQIIAILPWLDSAANSTFPLTLPCNLLVLTLFDVQGKLTSILLRTSVVSSTELTLVGAKVGVAIDSAL